MTKKINFTSVNYRPSDLLPNGFSVGLIVPQVIWQKLLVVKGALADGQQRVDDGVQDPAIARVRHFEAWPSKKKLVSYLAPTPLNINLL